MIPTNETFFDDYVGTETLQSYSLFLWLRAKPNSTAQLTSSHQAGLLVIGKKNACKGDNS